MPDLSLRSERLQPQPMFTILSAAAQLEGEGRQVIHLEIGDTRGYRNELAIEELRRLIEDPDLGYVPSAGISALREAFSRSYSAEKGVEFGPEHVVVAPANALIVQWMGVVTDPGDFVLVPDPGFPTYFLSAAFNELEAVPYTLRPDQGWDPSVEQLAALLDGHPRARALIVNSPSNPLGSVIKPDTLDRILQLAADRQVHCMFDETYKNLVFDAPRPSPRHFANTSYLYSLSKDAAAPGLRVGCIVSEDTQLIGKLGDYNSMLFSCGPGLLQRAALAYIQAGGGYAAQMRAETGRRVEQACRILGHQDVLRFERPRAAFYLFVDVRRTGMEADAFAHALLRERGVCVCPGEAFGTRGAGHVRVTLSGDATELEHGLGEIASFAAAEARAHA